MKNSVLKFTAFVLFILFYTTIRAQSTVNTSQEALIDSSIFRDSSTKLSTANVDLKARKRNNSVALEWITENEKGINLFEIERSDDGKFFYRLEQKPSKDGSKTAYIYLDQNPLPVNYYRLKLIGEDGNYNYSKVIVVSPNGNLSSTIQPNPFMQSFAVHTYLPFPQPIKIQLLDMSGKLIRYKSIAGITGNNKVEFDDVGNLQPGIYMVRIVRADSIIEKKIVKGNQ
jgi:hypothetical protein